MVIDKAIETNWYPDKRLLVTHISGELDKNDIDNWKKAFKNSLRQIQNNTTFKIFVNMYGFRAATTDAHKNFRDVVPLTLAKYGWKVGYMGLFEEETKTVIFKKTRGIRCVGAAHSHHDKTKMDFYESRFSTDREHFFRDPSLAKQWIEKLELID